MGEFSVALYKALYHKEPPAYVKDYTIGHLLFKPLRKWMANTVAANCPFNKLRVSLYRLCGFKIGKGTSIGMRCFFDDHCHDMIEIGAGVTLSYGVYFACHGIRQPHLPIRIEDGAYVGMSARIISKNREAPGDTRGVTIGKGAIVGAGTLVNCDVPPGATVVGVPCRIFTSGCPEI